MPLSNDERGWVMTILSGFGTRYLRNERPRIEKKIAPLTCVCSMRARSIGNMHRHHSETVSWEEKLQNTRQRLLSICFPELKLWRDGKSTLGTNVFRAIADLDSFSRLSIVCCLRQSNHSKMAAFRPNTLLGRLSPASLAAW